jgi:hypothetical protein
MSSVWACLYTHQKTKKAKTWQDGILKVSVNNKVNSCPLGDAFIKISN